MQPLLYLAQTFNDTYTTTTPTSTNGAAVLSFMIASLVFLVLPILVMAAIQIAGMWKVYAKAKQPGWAAIIPIYNMYILQLIVGRPGWWTVLYFIPGVNIVISIINSIDLAKSFGKDTVYALLLIFVPVIGYPMLGFGSAQYNGPSASGSSLNNLANTAPNSAQTPPPSSSVAAAPPPVTPPTAPNQPDEPVTPSDPPTPPQDPLVQ